jgi:hypothetical protein
MGRLGIAQIQQRLLEGILASWSANSPVLVGLNVTCVIYQQTQGIVSVDLVNQLRDGGFRDRN